MGAGGGGSFESRSWVGRVFSEVLEAKILAGPEFYMVVFFFPILFLTGADERLKVR